MGEEDNAWLVDMIVQMVNSPSWNEPIDAFVAEKCLMFDSLEEEMKHEYMECHQEFGGLVESLLAAHLLEVDISPEDFERQVMESGLKDDERMQRVVLQLVAAEDFLEFRNLMLRQHMKMQEAAGNFGGMTAEEERLANDAAIAAAIAADASTMEEQQAAAESLAPGATAPPAVAAVPGPVAPAPAPSAAEERAFGAAGGSYGRAVLGARKPAGSAKAAAIRKALVNGLRPNWEIRVDRNGIIFQFPLKGNNCSSVEKHDSEGFPRFIGEQVTVPYFLGSYSFTLWQRHAATLFFDILPFADLLVLPYICLHCKGI